MLFRSNERLTKNAQYAKNEEEAQKAYQTYEEKIGQLESELELSQRSKINDEDHLRSLLQKKISTTQNDNEMLKSNLKKEEDKVKEIMEINEKLNNEINDKDSHIKEIDHQIIFETYFLSGCA